MALKHLPVLNHSADYICISFGIIEPILVILKIEYRSSRRYVCGGRGVGAGVYSLANNIAVYIKRLCITFIYSQQIANIFDKFDAFIDNEKFSTGKKIWDMYSLDMI